MPREMYIGAAPSVRVVKRVSDFVGEETDPYWDNVTLLFQPGTNDLAPRDRGPFGHTLTAAGDAALSTAVSDPWGGARKLLRLDGTGDYLTVAASTGLDFSTAAFTIEGWIRIDAAATNPGHYIFFTADGATKSGLQLDDNAGGTPGDVIARVANTEYAQSSGQASATTWHHVAMCRDGSGNVYTWLDGTDGGTATGATGSAGSNATAFIGAFNGTFVAPACYLTAVRVTKGVARYTSAFAAPAEPFPIKAS